MVNILAPIMHEQLIVMMGIGAMMVAIACVAMTATSRGANPASAYMSMATPPISILIALPLMDVTYGTNVLGVTIVLLGLGVYLFGWVGFDGRKSGQAIRTSFAARLAAIYVATGLILSWAHIEAPILIGWLVLTIPLGMFSLTPERIVKYIIDR